MSLADRSRLLRPIVISIYSNFWGFERVVLNQSRLDRYGASSDWKRFSTMWTHLALCMQSTYQSCLSLPIFSKSIVVLAYFKTGLFLMEPTTNAACGGGAKTSAFHQLLYKASCLWKFETAHQEWRCQEKELILWTDVSIIRRAWP